MSCDCRVTGDLLGNVGVGGRGVCSAGTKWIGEAASGDNTGGQ